MDITSHDAVDMASKFGTFILVDGVSSAGVGSMDTNLVLMNIKSTLVSTFLQFGSKLFYKSSVSSEIQKRSFMRSPQPIPTTCRTSKQSSSWHGCSPPPFVFHSHLRSLFSRQTLSTPPVHGHLLPIHTSINSSVSILLVALVLTCLRVARISS